MHSFDTVSDFTKLILHCPAEVNGYEEGGNRFALFCIFNDELAIGMKWYRDGSVVSEGSPVYQTLVTQPGIYSVVVRGRNDAETAYVRVTVHGSKQKIKI